jgi:sec-independent protein translocase protein TatC
MIISLVFVKDVTSLVMKPITDLGVTLFMPGVTDGFMISLTISFYAGIIMSFPFLLYFLAEFVLPALTTKEKRILVPGVFAGFVLFGAGAYISYRYVLPATLGWFVNYNSEMHITQQYAVREYFSLVSHLTIACGLLCELPVGVLGMAALGLVTFPMLSKSRPYAITAILVVVALIAPTPDPLTFLTLSLPVIAIYEMCIWIVWIMDRRRVRLEAGEIRTLE